jgi:hypothetical protein
MTGAGSFLDQGTAAALNQSLNNEIALSLANVLRQVIGNAVSNLDWSRILGGTQ